MLGTRGRMEAPEGREGIAPLVDGERSARLCKMAQEQQDVFCRGLPCRKRGLGLDSLGRPGSLWVGLRART